MGKLIFVFLLGMGYTPFLRGQEATGIVPGISTTSAQTNDETNTDSDKVPDSQGFSSIHGAHTQAMQIQNLGRSTKRLGTMMAVSFFSKCTWKTPWNCILGAMALKDANAAGRAGRNAGWTKAPMEGNGNKNGNEGGDGNEDEDGDASLAAVDTGNGGNPNNDDEQVIQNGLDELGRHGWEMVEDGLRNRKTGRLLKRKHVSDPKKLMRELGLSKGQAMAAMKSLADTRSKALAKMSSDGGQAGRGLASLDMEEDEESGSSDGGATGGKGSGGEGSSASSGGGGGGMLSSLGGSGFRKSKKKERRGNSRGGVGKDALSPEEAAGLSKDLNGHHIGIAMANIFLIVHQKYREKRDQGTEFINREH